MSKNFLIAATIGIAIVCCSVASADDDSFLEKPIMIDAVNGWWQQVGDKKSETLHTVDGGKTWQNVTPNGVRRALQQQSPEFLENEFLSGYVCIDPLSVT